MTCYRVIWEIDIEADSAAEAAAQALVVMRDSDPANTATVFTCVDKSGTAHYVDLAEECAG